MENQTHYQVLGVDENASSDHIEFAYQRLLKDAKDKLQDSPLFYEKENKLKHAYQTLSNQALRQAYNNKLSRERAKVSIDNYPSSDAFNLSEFLSGFIFSKAFLGSIVLIIVLLVLLPSGEDRVAKEVFNKKLDYEHQIRNQEMLLARQREERYYSNQEGQEERTAREQERRETAELRQLEMEERRLNMAEQREREKFAREERRLALQEEREARRLEYDLKRKLEREKREEKYKKQREENEAKRRSREFIESTKRTTELQKDAIRLKAGYD